jgi:pimeloyl-ACP methyl ester carboxylesterase
MRPPVFLACAVDKPKVSRPVHVVSCDKDRLMPASVVRKLAKRYPRATQRHDAERGHWLIDDEETEMMHAICGWLRSFEQRTERTAP